MIKKREEQKMSAENKDTGNIKAGMERHRRATPESVIQLVIFRLEDESFGTDINQVREIVSVGPVTPIPDSPDFIKGVTNIRGEIIIVIDLKERFSLPSNNPVESKHIVITGQDGNLYGVLVDEVTEVLRVSRADVKTTPHLITKIDRSYISEVIILEDRLIMVLDFRKVLSEEELNKLARLKLDHSQMRHEELNREPASQPDGEPTNQKTGKLAARARRAK